MTKLLSYDNRPGIKVLRLAPTGVSAIKIRGETYYSALQIPPKCGKTLTRLSSSKLYEIEIRFREVQVVFLDEISFVDLVNFDFINQRLNEIFGKSNTSSRFGERTFIVAGDFLQLPPIMGSRVYGDYVNPMRNIDKLWDYFKMIELSSVVRQNDLKLINLLNNCRIGEPTEDDLELLETRHTDVHPVIPEHVMHIFAENSLVNARNKDVLDKNPNPIFTIAAIDKLPSGITELKKNQVIKNQSQMKLGGLATIFEVKVGSHVMMTQNIDVKDHLANGQTGIVQSIKENQHNSRPKIIYVTFDDKEAGIDAKRSDQYANANDCVPVTETETQIQIGGIYFSRKQFPLMLANAATVHKCQGLEFNSILVSFQLLKQRQFNPGQIYVALSRCQNLEGLYITGDIKKTHIRADKGALQEYERLRKEATYTPVTRFKCCDNSLILAHLNVRSFNAHCADIIGDHILLNCDLILLSETQVENIEGSNNRNYTPLSKYIEGYKVFFQNEDDKYLSLAVCYKSGLEFELIETMHYAPGVMLFNISKPSFSPQKFCILLIYRKVNSRREAFHYVLNGMIRYHEIDFILGDFNMDGLLENFDIPELINYRSLISLPTQISGGMLDHVYMRENFDYDVESIIKHLYFSDHDATLVQIK